MEEDLPNIKAKTLVMTGSMTAPVRRWLPSWPIASPIRNSSYSKGCATSWRGRTRHCLAHTIPGNFSRPSVHDRFLFTANLRQFFMGAVVGAVASGEVPADGNGDAFSTWLAPPPLLTGVLFVATSAYLAAVFLVGDARRSGAPDLLALLRAPGAGRRRGRRHRRRGRPGRAARRSPLRLRPPGRPGPARHRLVPRWPRAARRCCCGAAAPTLWPLAAGAVIAVIWGWGVAQWPYLLPTSMRIDQAAAPYSTLDIVFVVFGAAAVLSCPRWDCCTR